MIFMTKQRLIILFFSVLFLFVSPVEAKLNLAFWKKNKKIEKVKPDTKFKQLSGNDTVEWKGVANVIEKGDTMYLQVPVKLMNREWLVVNRLQQVPKELNEAGVNKGINYSWQTIRMEWDSKSKHMDVRQQRITPEYDQESTIAYSVKANYIDPLIARIKIEAVSDDSTAIIIKVNDLFNGKDKCLNDVFNEINLGTSPVSELSKILGIKAFENNITAISELTTTVREGNDKVNVTVVVSTTLSLLPEIPMQGREESQRVGYFTTKRLRYTDSQRQTEHKSYITRWRLEPKDSIAYMSGKLSEPKKPIVFYIDNAMPEYLRPYIVRGIEEWNVAFEKAGFKNAVVAKIWNDSISDADDDMKYSLLTYAASEKANAMGPSVIDPRTGEILEADIIWWHNVQTLVRDMIVVQTGSTNPAARTMHLPDSLIGEAARFVACHEVGHSLGLRHNMIASASFPTDSLRSASFMNRVGGTSASIMDYARFNYVAQPEDNIQVISPHIGPYDLMAIEWGYRWYPDEEEAKPLLFSFLNSHNGKEYRYSEAQSARSAVDPRSLSEDLGDDAMKSASYGIANLKRIVPNIIEWTTTGKPGQSYDDAAELYMAVISQWSLFHYHVMANIGGIYLENTTIGDGKKTFEFVEKERQKAALQWLLDEILCYPKWLFDTPLEDYTYLHRNTPYGVYEQSPSMVLKNQQNYVFWDLLDNNRLLRMIENEHRNGNKAFTIVEMMSMLHNHIFAKTLSGKNPDVMERSLQKSFVDALITAAAESEGVKINKHINDNVYCNMLGSESREIVMGNTQINRNSDAISVKRGELINILNLLKSKRNTVNKAVQMHYDDVILRIQTALGLQK